MLNRINEELEIWQVLLLYFFLIVPVIMIIWSAAREMKRYNSYVGNNEDVSDNVEIENDENYPRNTEAGE